MIRCSPSSRTQRAQRGFTLLELLIAMVLVLVLVLGVQRFIAGVVADQEMVFDRQANASEMQIVLSNLSRDVAQANFYPYATLSGELSTARDLKPCSGGGCKNLFAVRYAAPIGAKDCNGSSTDASEKASLIDGSHGRWKLIDNRYVLTKDNGITSFSCDGSGGEEGQRDHADNVVQIVANALLNDGAIINLTDSPQYIPLNTRLVQICAVTRVPQSQNVGDVAAATKDCNDADLVNNNEWIHYKIQLDVAVGSFSFVGAP